MPLEVYTANQCQRGEPRAGALPERGVVEVKGIGDDAWLTADTRQISKYFGRYRLVLVTDYRDFLLIGDDADGRAVKLESFRLASSARAFWEAASRTLISQSGDDGQSGGIICPSHLS